MGTLVGAVALIALAVAGTLLLNRHRRGRSTHVIDDPVVATETTKSSIINAISLMGPRLSDPKDIVIDKDERGSDMLLGEGSFGEVGSAQC